MGVFFIVASDQDDKEKVSDILKPIGTILAAAWREEGNAILYLTSDQVTNQMITIPLTGITNYPFGPDGDEAFINRERLIELVKSTNLTEFKLQCGLNPDDDGPMVTAIVFWSEDGWEGVKQEFFCGAGFSAYEIEQMISSAQSFCIYTEMSGADRIQRCSLGPACDDAILNGNESDIDCGGSCDGCRDGSSCNDNSDCQGDCLNGQCYTPTCYDGIQNQDETDVDCGGWFCSRCQLGGGCTTNEDCLSSNCEEGTCVPLRTCGGQFANANFRNRRITVKLSSGCVGRVWYLSNDRDEAKVCAAADGYEVVEATCLYSFYRTESSSPITVEAPTLEDARNCANCYVCDYETGWCGGW
ncbi:hypothetical protein [Ekhidna sp.]|uniref:hypothetical protein n=1 Tax=Ekhidna sp. TaxID=2608089 RepID=UPI003B5004B4